MTQDSHQAVDVLGMGGYLLNLSKSALGIPFRGGVPKIEIFRMPETSNNKIFDL